MFNLHLLMLRILRSGDDESLLMSICIEKNYMKQCFDLLNKGFDINTMYNDISLLTLAIMHDRDELAKFLIELGCDIDKSLNKHNPLYCSLIKNKLSIFRFILEKNPEIVLNDIVIDGKDLLFYAIDADNVSAVLVLIEYKVNTNKGLWGDIKPMDAAIHKNNKEIITAIIRNGTHISKYNYRSLYERKHFDLINLSLNADFFTRCHLCLRKNDESSSVSLICKHVVHIECLDNYSGYIKNKSTSCCDCNKRKRKRESYDCEDEQ